MLILIDEKYQIYIIVEYMLYFVSQISFALR